MDMDKLFIYNLKKWRKNMGFSQEKLAEKCNTAHSYIRQLESGKGHPSFALIGKIADALQIEPYQLFYDESVLFEQNSRAKYIKTIQKNLIKTMSVNIQDAFSKIAKNI